jgi:hypothetical protein
MDKKNDDNMPFAVGVGGIVAAALYSQKQTQIKHWLYENMMMLVFAAFAILAFIVYRGIHKLKKKEEEAFKRLKAVHSVKPKNNENEFYRRG